MSDERLLALMEMIDQQNTIIRDQRDLLRSHKLALADCVYSNQGIMPLSAVGLISSEDIQAASQRASIRSS